LSSNPSITKRKTKNLKVRRTKRPSISFLDVYEGGKVERRRRGGETREERRPLILLTGEAFGPR
jgi:hypothetical protein